MLGLKMSFWSEEFGVNSSSSTLKDFFFRQNDQFPLEARNKRQKAHKAGLGSFQWAVFGVEV